MTGDIKDITNSVCNPRDDDNPQTEPFKCVDELSPQEARSKDEMEEESIGWQGVKDLF